MFRTLHFKHCQGKNDGVTCRHTRIFSKARFRENSQIVVAMEAAMSTKHGSKIKFNVRYVVSFCGFSVHALQPKLWNIEHQTRRGAILKNELNIKGMHM